LNLALSQGSAAAVRALAEAGANLQHTDKQGTPVLHHAVGCGSDKLDAILEFLDRVDLNQADSKGRTILYSGRIDLASFKRVISAGATINARDFEGYTPLGVQAMLGNIQHVKHLLAHGADVNLLSKHHGGPLHLAARYTSDLAMVKLLVEHGADVNIAAPVPGTPLAAACLYSDPTADADDKVQRQLAVIRYLLDHNANVSGQGGVLGCPINAAACSASPEAIRLLLSKGARIDAQNAMGVSPIHLAAFNSLDVFESVVDAGGDLQARDLFGRTPLHWAAQPGCFDVVHHILSLGHSGKAINAADRDGWTAICWAARGPSGWGSGRRRPPPELGGVVRLLLEGGASRAVEVTVQGQKWTPLKIARYHRAPAPIIGLLEYGLAWDGQSKKEDEHNVVPNPDDETRPARRDEKSACDGCFSVSCRRIITNSSMELLGH
jgi:ankyrin repeat protein